MPELLAHLEYGVLPSRRRRPHFNGDLYRRHVRAFLPPKHLSEEYLDNLPAGSHGLLDLPAMRHIRGGYRRNRPSAEWFAASHSTLPKSRIRAGISDAYCSVHYGSTNKRCFSPRRIGMDEWW